MISQKTWLPSITVLYSQLMRIAIGSLAGHMRLKPGPTVYFLPVLIHKIVYNLPYIV